MSRNINCVFVFILLGLSGMGCSCQKAECLVFDSDTCLVRTCIQNEQPNQELPKAGYKTGDHLYRIDVVEWEQTDGDCVIKNTKTTCYDSLELFEKTASEVNCEKKDPKLCVVESACDKANKEDPGWVVYSIWDKQVKSFPTEEDRKTYINSDEKIVEVAIDEDDPIRKELSLPENSIFITKKIRQELQSMVNERFAGRPSACVKIFDNYIQVMTAMPYDAEADEVIECPWLEQSEVNDLFVIQAQDISVKIYINKYDFDYALRYFECKNMTNDHWCIVE